jgi:hypothetical protein
MKLRKTTRNVMSELTVKKPVKEGVMADLSLLAQESQTYQEFEKKFMQEYGEGKPLAPEEKELLQALFDEAQTMKEASKTGLLEVVKKPVSREIVTMICEVASDYGVQKLPKKQWSSTVSLVRYITEKLDKKDRIEFVKTVKSLRESMGIEEYVINL